MSFRLWEIFKDPDKRAVISWLGGGAVVVAGSIWTVVTFVVEHKDASGKKDGTTVTVSGQGIASGGNTTINAPATLGPSKEQIEQIQKPLVEQIAALTKMLLEKYNPDGSPGKQQAVGEAVQSIAQGAAEGDARLQQAFDLMKQNKIADATRLLNAVAEEKTARAEQENALAAKDRKEAAIAYRNLGVIASLADPKRALEAYEKALELNPNDVVSLVGIGGIRIYYGDLNEAQARLERALTLAKTDDQEVYKFCALLCLGDIKQRRGPLADALKSYQDGLATAERLAKSDPGNAGWQFDLGISNESIGEVQMAQGDLAAALKSYQARQEIILRLAKSDPGNVGWQRDLSVSYDRIGDVQTTQGDLAVALKSYNDSLVVRDRLAKSNPDNAGWQRDLSVSFNKIGDVQMAQGDLARALKSYNDSLAIFDRLAKSDPGNAGWQRDVSVSYERVGDVQKEQGNLSAARQS
jgi:tetratricopeptide (TPR) repeat protein